MRYCYENPILTEQINNNIYLLTIIQANIDDFKQRLSAPLRSEVTVQKCQKRPFSTIKVGIQKCISILQHMIHFLLLINTNITIFLHIYHQHKIQLQYFCNVF